MKILSNQIEQGLAVVAVGGALVRANALQDLSREVIHLKQLGCKAILFDLAKVQRMNMAGLAALIELVSRNHQTEFGFCALPPKPLAFLRKSGLDRGVRIFSSTAEAQSDPTFQRFLLSGVKTVLLCAGKGSRVAPLTGLVPKPLLDIAGRPTMHRIIDHLAQFGLRDIVLNPGHLGNQIIDYFRATPMPDAHITFANEGQWLDGQWQAAPIGSASTLRRLQDRNAAFDSDVVVLCADALIDLDIGEMMRAHRASGAAATIAALRVPREDTRKYGIIEVGRDHEVTRFVEKPSPSVTDSTLANSGIYIFKPQVFDLLSQAEGLDIAYDLLPTIMSMGQKIHVYAKEFSWVDIGCGRDYAQAVQKSLSGQVCSMAPMGREILPYVWAMPDAQVSRRAKITGPCHIGSGARIAAGAELNGFCTVGAGAVVEERTYLRDCLVMPDTRVAAGAWAKNMILNATWAVDHRYADGSVQNSSAYEHVGPIENRLLLNFKKSA